MGLAEISILIPNYNSGGYVDKCIDSVRKQTFSDWEVVICDSGSTDGSAEKLKAFSEDDDRVRFYTVPKDGVYAGWNECLIRARGKFVYFATADDIFSENLLERLYGLLSESRDASLAFVKLVYVDDQGGGIRKLGGALWQ